jgi:hypothetical protein
MRKMNDLAQWQLIEVILVAGILFAAMYLVKSSNITVYKSIEGEDQLKAQGYDALESLASQPSEVNGYHSKLVYYIIQDHNSLKTYLDSFFSSDVNYRIEMTNMTKFKNNQVTLAECTTTLVDSTYWIGEKSCTATRIVEYYNPVTSKSDVYRVVLYLWYNT